MKEINMVKEIVESVDVSQWVTDKDGYYSNEKGYVVPEDEYKRLLLAEEIVQTHISLSDLDGLDILKELDYDEDYFEDANWLLFQIKKDIKELYKQYKGAK